MADDRVAILVDFDGVIHQYKKPPTALNDIPDPPVNGAKDAIAKLREKYYIAVFTTRARTLEGSIAVRKWLNKHGIEFDEVTAWKIPGRVIVDDRAIQFNGSWWDGILEQIENFVPWNRRSE